ncbi:hypothetical protein CRG98_034909 [Punica granatum]|uniref:Uncharacterized protein n=1 Tax=Punica granatum TaxID=22663 RepID=A0A2I0IL57_PUNGR|nr:hypothetical protein CRG98_034909 [Punica granatum]
MMSEQKLTSRDRLTPWCFPENKEKQKQLAYFSLKALSTAKQLASLCRCRCRRRVQLQLGASCGPPFLLTLSLLPTFLASWIDGGSSSTPSPTELSKVRRQCRFRWSVATLRAKHSVDSDLQQLIGYTITMFGSGELRIGSKDARPVRNEDGDGSVPMVVGTSPSSSWSPLGGCGGGFPSPPGVAPEPSLVTQTRWARPSFFRHRPAAVASKRCSRHHRARHDVGTAETTSSIHSLSNWLYSSSPPMAVSSLRLPHPSR